MKLYMRPLAIAGILTLAAPTSAFACACGCGVFDVGDGSVMPVASDSGLSVWFRYNYLDQNRNQERSADAPAADNSDQRIATSFFTLGGEYRINRRWTVMAELPLYKRRFTTTASDNIGNDVTETVPLTDLGDGVIQLTYAGFSPAMTTGVSLGVKLPTGRYTSPLDRYGNAAYDRDTLPGTGSTDLQVGAHHVGAVAPRLTWFAQAQYRFAVATRDGYRPGNELNAALGLSYDLTGGGQGIGIAPALQLVGSVRAHDSGVNADPLNSGYQRLLIAPGVKFQLTRKLSIYGDVALPIAQYANAAASLAIEGKSGQLVAPALFKLQVNYGF